MFRMFVTSEQVEEAGVIRVVNLESWHGVGQVMEGNEQREGIILMPSVLRVFLGAEDGEQLAEMDFWEMNFEDGLKERTEAGTWASSFDH